MAASPLPSGVAVQQQVRANAQELNDFLRGFAAWQRDITKKDKQLIQAAAEATAKEVNSTSDNGDVSDRRPGRMSSPPPPNVPSPLKVDHSSRPSTSKDDVKVALKFTEGAADMKEATTSSQVLIQKQEASAEKDRGNDHFKSGRYDQAIESYTRGIKADPTNAILPANRAMALLKKGRHKEAESDCTLSMSLDPTYVKAYQRRATARSALKDLSGAVKDFEKVLALEPSNKQAKAEISKLETRMKEEKTKAVPKATKKAEEVIDVKENLRAGLFKGNSVPGQVFPIDKKPHLRSKKPLRRVDIAEVNSSANVEPEETAIEVSTKSSGDFLIRESKTTTNRKIQIVEVSGEASLSSQSPPPVSKNPPNDTQVQSKIQIVEVSDGAPPSSQSPPSASQSPPPPATSRSSGKVRKVEEQILHHSDDKSQQQKVSLMAPVTSSMAFYATWKGLATSGEKFHFLERQMTTAESYPALFNHSLEAEVFEDIVDVLHDTSTMSGAGDLSRHLVGLSKVPRMSAMVMFMDNGAKLKKLVKKHIVQNELFNNKSQTESVMKCFM